MPKISACIVAYCDYDEVCAAVRSVLANTPGDDFALYVVDNASPDGCGPRLAQTDFGDVRVQVICLPKNLGFGKGHNSIMDRLTSDVHFILNPDVIIHDDILPQMAQWLLDHPGVVMATPQLYFPDGRIQNLPRRKPTPWLLLARQLVWMKGRGDMKSIPAVGLLAGNLLVTIGLYYVISSDMGSALVYVCIFACMAFAAGVALRWFALGIFGAGAGFYLLWELDKIPPYMKERFQVLVDHSLYPLGAGWQQTRSLMAIGGGRLTGQGLLHGAQTQSTSSVNLPFRHTDFIFCTIGEELGM